MSKPIRILQVLAALDSGGVSNFIMNLYRRIDTRQIQFDFAITAGKKSLFDDEVLLRGGRIFYCDNSKSVSYNLRRIIMEEGPFRAVHSHLFFFSGLVMAEAKRAKVPIRIAHAHNAFTGEGRSLVRFAYEHVMQYLIRRNATHLLGCSEKACCYVFGKGAFDDSRVAVIPDGIDFERFSFNPQVRKQVRKEYKLDDKFVVGHVGHFNPAKNHEKVLSVFVELSHNRDDAALLLVGDGELEQNVRNRVKEMGLFEKVIFAGAHRDVERFYQAMDVFLFPSRFEGFGMALIEAQIGGLLCVASDVVPRETNLDGRTVYFPLEESDSTWANALLASSRDRISVSRETQLASKLYDVRIVARELCEIYLKE